MNDDEALDLYVKRVNELLSTRLVTSGDLRTSLSMRASVDQPMELSVHEPDEEALRSFLLTFRQFVSDKEGTRVAQDIYAHIRDDIYDRFFDATAQPNDGSDISDRS